MLLNVRSHPRVMIATPRTSISTVPLQPRYVFLLCKCRCAMIYPIHSKDNLSSFEKTLQEWISKLKNLHKSSYDPKVPGSQPYALTPFMYREWATYIVSVVLLSSARYL